MTEDTQIDPEIALHDKDSAIQNTGYVLQDQVGFLLRRANQRHLGIFSGHMPSGITAQQFAVLVRIRELGQTSQNELGRQVAMDQSTINGVVQRLKARGLIKSVRAELDQRRILLSLTDDGLETLETLMPLAHEISERTLAPLSERERKALIRLLRKIS